MMPRTAILRLGASLRTGRLLSGGRRILALVVLLVAGVLGMGAAPALAADGVTISATAGVEGLGALGRPTPIRISISSTRTVRGTLSIAQINGPPSIRGDRDIEVAAGTTKEVWMSLSASPFGFGGNVEIVMSERNGDKTRHEVAVGIASDVNLIGVLPRLAAASSPPKEMVFGGDLGSARIAKVDPAQLRLGPDGITMFDIIAASANDLTQLDAVDLNTVVAWVHAGGQLLVDDDPAGALPKAWVPGLAGYIAAGHGEVRLTNGSLAAGTWADTIQVAPATNNNGQGSQVLSKQVGSGPPISTLTSDAGLRLRRLGPVLLLLVLYLALIGPILFFVLRSIRRLPMAWVAIPILALVTSGLVAVVGGKSRTSKSASHVTITELTPTGAIATTNGLIFSNTAGRRGLRYGPGWSAKLSQSGDFSQVVVERRDDTGVEVFAELGSGQAKLLDANGLLAASEISDGIELTAVSDTNGTATGVVRNTGKQPLDDVAVFVGLSATYLGRIEPGAQLAYVVEAAATPVDIPAEYQVWSNDQGSFFEGGGFFPGNQGKFFPGREPIMATIAAPFPVTTLAPGANSTVADEPVVPRTQGSMAAQGSTPSASISAWIYAQRGRQATTMFGTAQAVGWRRDATGPLATLNGQVVTAGRIAIAAIAPVTPTRRITDITVRRELVRTSGFNQDQNGPSEAGIARFVLPPESTGDKRVFTTTTPPWMTELAMWDGSTWQSIDVTGPRTNVPDSAIRSGVILARFKAALLNDPGGTNWTVQERE